MRQRLCALLSCAAALPVAAQDTPLQDRLRALARPAPIEIPQPYVDEITADLDRIAQESAWLFAPKGDLLGPHGADMAIVLFVSEGCADCQLARAELQDLAARLGIGAKVLDVSANPEAAAALDRLTLDVTPAYVMRDKLIRGQMPSFVLERYLTPQPTTK